MARSPTCRGAGRRGLLRCGLATALAVAVGLGAACAPGGEVTAERSSTTTTTAPPARRVPDAVGGALRAAVPPPDEPMAGGPEHEVLLYGDSVALLIADDLAMALDAPLVVDAVDCRRLDRAFTGPCGGVPTGTDVDSGVDGIAPAAELLDDPAGAAAVVVMANNAALDPDDLDAAMAALAPIPRIWWVTSRVDGRGWQDPNNRLLAELAARDPRAAVIDWFAASDGQGWLVDNVHPGDEGQAALADLVADHLRCGCTP